MGATIILSKQGFQVEFIIISIWLSCIQVIDLSSVSPELAYLASDADLVMLEGMVSFLCLWDTYGSWGNKTWLVSFIQSNTRYHGDEFIILISLTIFLQGRAIETNLYAQLKCDSMKIGMVLSI